MKIDIEAFLGEDEHLEGDVESQEVLILARVSHADLIDVEDDLNGYGSVLARWLIVKD